MSSRPGHDVGSSQSLAGTEIDQTSNVELTNRLRAEYFNRIAHDLRTPLTTALLMIDLIRGGGSQDELEEFWGLLSSQIVSEQELIEKLLAATRTETHLLDIQLNVEPHALKPLISAALNQSKASASFEQPDDDEREVLADHDGLIRALVCVLDNAVKFSPKDSAITVTSKIREDLIVIEVADRGPGIHLDDLALVLVPYFRGQNATTDGSEGTGLGLSEVDRLVQAMNGQVKVAARPGGGTVVSLILPTP